MYRQLKTLLPSAKGESHPVVVIFLDIRGFSSFAKIAESVDAAIYLRSIYLKILDDYFPNFSFFKPTGDGLMIILNFEDVEQLTQTINDAVNASLRLIQDFPTLTAKDPMINFTVPDALGIGLSRGSATALVSDDQVLDYSGRPLNLAARLMDLARPRGVVFDESLGWELLKIELRNKFSRELAYIRGISEDSPINVYVMTNEVQLADVNRRPIHKYEWRTTEREEMSLKALRQRGNFLFDLPEEPALADDIRVHVSYPMVTVSGRKHPSFITQPIYKAVLEKRRGNSFAIIDCSRIADELANKGVKETWQVKVLVEYAVDLKPEPATRTPDAVDKSKTKK
jgi:class 3 adenylate cyclase